MIHLYGGRCILTALNGKKGEQLMHLFVLVFLLFTAEQVREKVEALLDPQDDGRAFPYRKVYLSPQVIPLVADMYGVQHNDIQGLAAVLRQKSAGGLDERGIYSLDSCNPRDHWESWMIGGRWDGAVQDRWDGKRVEDDLAVEGELAQNSRRVADLPHDLIPYAVVSPDGIWHEQGFDPLAWAHEYRRLRSHYSDCLAIVVDCEG